MNNQNDLELSNDLKALLNEIKNEQINVKNDVLKNHKVYMQKISKLLEYNQICDMTNQVFEKRISSIEKLLYEVFKG